ncbi:MAG TPA: CPBP family intramembrane glutamic endopeptidase [Candidatus Saccharimonadales bacterium]|nr:CPBP family intramembrane glutamic endopeptidase [Candidatus Saccharimonadales bacterium]
MKPLANSKIEFVKLDFLILAYLVIGFLCALLLRVTIGRPDVSHSAIAGLLFAACLASLAASCGVKLTINKRVVITGLLGGAFLCLPAVFFRHFAIGGHTPDGNYVAWSLIVATVAFAEEAFLRSALYDKVTDISNQKIAIFVAAVTFAILHLPLYGWQAMPLDFVVGLWLGALRYSSGSFVTPGIAHVLADLAAWWI